LSAVDPPRASSPPAGDARWAVIEQLFGRAIELPHGRRDEFLVSACPDDEGVRRDVRGLLAAHDAVLAEGGDEGGRFLEQLDAQRAVVLIESGTGADLLERLQSALGTAYRVERELDGAGMSRVFVAEQPELGRRVVIKVLPPDVAGSVSVERFQREVRLAARLQHPHIVPVFSAGETDGIPFYTMPYVEGESLRARIVRDGPLPVDEAISILRDVAKALEFAHGRGVVHRDIKPGNVLLAGNSALVTDFGIAKAVEVAREQSGADLDPGSPVVGTSWSTAFATASVVTGTPGYMAPEQAAGEPTLDHRVDIYAFGCLAYEVLAGVPPFPHRTVSELIIAHQTETPDTLRLRRAGAPPALETLVARCLEKLPRERPQSAADILRTLDGVRARPFVSRRLAALLSVTAFILLAAVGMFATWRVSPVAAPPPPAVARDTRPAVAVLPMRSAGGDQRGDYFADGMTDELTVALQRVPGLRVASRTSIHALQIRGLTPDSLASALSVGHLLAGAVHREGDRLRVTAELTRAGDGQVVWADRYERKVADVFAVQEEIAQAIVSALNVSLDRAARLAPRGTGDVQAYDLYLRGLDGLRKRGPAGIGAAVEAFTVATRRDPGFARAWAGLASATSQLPFYHMVSEDSVIGPARAAAQRAIALDSTLAEPHAVLAVLHGSRWEWQQAEAEARRALELEPQSAPALYWYGELLYGIGRLDDALVVLRRAHEADRLYVMPLVAFAHTLSLSRRYEEAIGEARRAVATDPANGVARLVLGESYMFVGRLDAAEVELARAEVRLPIPEVTALLALVRAKRGRTAEADSIRRLIETRKQPGHAGALAMFHAGVGDTARCLDWLERAADRRELGPVRVGLRFAVFDAVRGSPRFARVAKRYNLDVALQTAPPR
jgi:TolB-like protein/Tfp pilus assembly protein PilF